MSIDLISGGTVKVSAPTPSFTQVRPPSAPNVLVIPGGDRGPAGRSITSVTRTSGTGAPGTTDTYTIAFSDGATSTFSVYNGADGSSGVTSVNGKTGPTVVLAASDVGAVPTARTITAGTGLTGGGDLTANRSLAVSYGTAAGTAAQGNDSRISGALQASLATTKGDLFVATASGTVTRLPAGSNSQVLTADSTQAAGLKWAAASGGGGGSALIGYTAYSPAGSTGYSITAGNATADLDATNLAVTFTAPASGAVVVSLSAVVSAAGTAGLAHWSLRAGTTNIAGTEQLVAAVASSNYVRPDYRAYITGLTPGSSYTYKWAARAATAKVVVYAGDSGPEFSASSVNYGPAVMQVWSA